MHYFKKGVMKLCNENEDAALHISSKRFIRHHQGDKRYSQIGYNLGDVNGVGKKIDPAVLLDKIIKDCTQNLR